MQAPQTLDQNHLEKVTDLQETEAGNFDEDYIEVQIDAHEKAVSLFEDYAENGDNQELREFAANTLPVLRQHQDHIKKLDEVE